MPLGPNHHTGNQPGELDWTSIFDGAKWFHLSGITPALSETAAAVSKEALEIARKLGLETSYDLNFRSKLWSPEEAQAANQDLVKFVTVLIGNEEDFEKSLGFKAEGTTEDFAELDPESYKEVVFRVADTYPNVKKIGTTLRDAKTGWLNDWRTLLFDGQQFYLSQIYKDLELVDRVGGGDSFSSGLIYSLLREKSAQEAVDFAGAYSALAHTFPGDFNWATVEEAEKAMQSGSVRISR